MNTPKRCYRAVAEPADNIEVQPLARQDIRKNAPRVAICIGIGIILVIFAFAISLIISYNLDSTNGAMQADEAALGFIDALDDDSDDRMYTYIPKQLRGSKFMTDAMNISEIRSLNQKYDIALSNFVIISSENVADSIQALEAGVYDTYKQDIVIADAVKMQMSADMRYKIQDTEQDANLNFTVICIKVGAKWYVYTGKILTDLPDSSNITFEQPSESTVYDIIKDYVAPVVKNPKPLEFSETALTELKSGKLTIDDKEYKMPEKYSAMTGLYTLAEDQLPDTFQTIEPNYILKNLPIAFVNNIYSMTDFSISIGNSSFKTINIKDGVVTTLYIGRPDVTYDYPDVYLPGNVTINTSYDDIVKMYGPLQRIYEGLDSDDISRIKDNIVSHEDCYSIYQLPLDNERNYIYFEFDSENKLAAIQYYYFDLN